MLQPREPVDPLPGQHAIAGYEFGPFRLDLTAFQLLREGTPVELTSRTFDVLALLLSQRHRVVTKEELLTTVWKDAVVTDDSLVQAVSTLRRALGDDATNPTYVATVARRGYRFTAPATEWVAPVAASRAAVPSPPAPESGQVPPALPPLPPPTRRTRLLAAAVGASLLIGAGGGWWIGRTASAGGQTASGGPLRFAQQPPRGTIFTSGGALSPDARRLAFTAEDVTGRSFLWVRTLEDDAPVRLDETEGAARPFWSPDSRFIGFVAKGRLKTVPVSGGTPTDVANVGTRAAGAAWSPRGRIIFSTWLSGFSSVSASGGAIQPLTTLGPGEVAHAWPQFLPDGDHFIYSVYSAQGDGLHVGSLSGDTQRRVLDADPGAIYSDTGHVVFARSGVLTAQRFDAASLTLSGEPFTVVGGNVTFPSMTNGTQISAAAGLLAIGGAQGQSELAWFDRGGRLLSTISSPAPLHNPSLSPDGRRVFANTFPPAPTAVWAVDVERGATTRILDGSMPVLSPDGITLAYAKTGASGGAVLLADLSAPDAEARPRITSPVDRMTPLQFASNRQALLYDVFTREGQDLWLLPLADGMPARPVVQTAANEMQGRLSPDGRWLAYASDESGRWEVYLQSYPAGNAKVAVSTGGGAEPHWRDDGRELYYLSEDRAIMAVSVTPGNPPSLGRPQPLFRPRVVGEPATYRSHYVPTSDGQRFLVDVLRDPALDPVTILLNWTPSR